jgi:hypothetical protein
MNLTFRGPKQLGSNTIPSGGTPFEPLPEHPEVIRVFTASQKNTRTVPWSKAQTLPSTFFPNHNSALNRLNN